MSKHGLIRMKLGQEVRSGYSGFFSVSSWKAPWTDTEEHFWV